MTVLKRRDERPPFWLHLRSSTTFIIATVWMSNFTDYFLYGMIVPVMPNALVERAGISWEDRGFWVSLLLTLEAGSGLVCCPLFGYLIDLSRTRQLPYLGGLILLGTSMVMLALAHKPWVFIAARVLQGSSSAMVMVAGLALITDTVTNGDLGQAIGYMGSSISCGFLLGPLLGGLVYENAGYNAVFGMAFAVVMLDLVMRCFVIEKRVAERWIIDGEAYYRRPSLRSRPQSAGSGEYHTFPGGPPQAEIETETEPQTREYAVEKQDQPVLLLLAKQPRILISSMGLMVQALLFGAFDSTLPIFVQTNYGWDAVGAGMVFFPSVIAAFFEPYFGHLSDKHGNRLISFLAFLFLTPTLLLLRFCEPNTLATKILFLSLLTLVGVFINLCMPALFVETQSVLESMERAQPGVFGKRGAVAQAFGLQIMYQFLGMALGPLLGGFFEWRFGWKAVTLALGVLAGVMAGPMLWLSGKKVASERGYGERSESEEGERLLDGDRVV